MRFSFVLPPRLGLVLGLACLLVLAPSAGAQSEDSYKLGPKDLIEVKVFELPELNVERRVSEEGTINLPLVGDINVQDKTTPELVDEIASLLEAKFLQQHASVSIQVKEFRSSPITLIGAVNQPGPLAISGRWTLLEALAAAGGLKENHGDILYVLRHSSNGLSDQVEIHLEDLLDRADPMVNIPILGNDLINVPAIRTITVYCLGAVTTPGAINFQSTERITLLAAIARAGGLNDKASSKITVKRRAENGLDLEIEVNYKRVLAGKDPDMPLQQNDLIVIKESFF